MAVQFKTYKVIYRRYAGLFFSMCVDLTDNELAYLESIHLFVEILDHYFSNVCELDLVFNFHKVCNADRYFCKACQSFTPASTLSIVCSPVLSFAIVQAMLRLMLHAY